MAGHRTLGRETDLSYALIRSLGEAERARAIIARSSLGNIITEPGREDALASASGLPLAAMDEGRRNLALELLEIYAGNLRGELAEAELAPRARRPGSTSSTSPGAARSRRAIPTTGACTARSRSIEYDNTQNNANHIHSVWHDLTSNWGRDLLREHYAHGHAHGLIGGDGRRAGSMAVSDYRLGVAVAGRSRVIRRFTGTVVWRPGLHFVHFSLSHAAPVAHEMTIVCCTGKSRLKRPGPRQ